MWDPDETTSTSTSSTSQQDERVAATDHAIVVQLKDGSTLNVVDPGSREAIQSGVEVFERLFGKVVDFADAAAKRERDTVKDVVGDFFTATEPADKAIAGDLLKYGAVVALGFVVAGAFSSR